MSKPLTAKQFQEDVAQMWKDSVQFAYQDLLDEAIKAERETIESELLKLKQGVAANSEYVQGRWDVIGEIQDIIRARGKT